MRKKLIALFASMCMIVSMLPVTAMAAEGVELYVGGQRITESGCYKN